MSTLKITALAALLTSAAAFAQDPQPTPPEQATPPADQAQPVDATLATEGQIPEFTTLDTNGDGYVSKDEAKANATLAAKWDELDADKNGALSSAEYQKAKDASGQK